MPTLKKILNAVNCDQELPGPGIVQLYQAYFLSTVDCLRTDRVIVNFNDDSSSSSSEAPNAEEGMEGVAPLID